MKTEPVIKVYSPESLANELQIPRRTVLKAIRAGKLKHVPFSTCVFRILATDAEEWIQTLRK